MSQISCNFNFVLIEFSNRCPGGEMVDTRDSKSLAQQA